MSDRSNEHDDAENRFDEVLAEYFRRVDDGEAVDQESFIQEHPHFANSLREYFQTAEQFERPNDRRLDETIDSRPGSTTAKPATDVIRYFGDYELIEEVARGGMGVVYKANQVKLNRIVAVKMILAGQLATEQDVKRFYAEAEAAANLHHPNIVPIYEIGEHQAQHFFSMGFIEGHSLAQMLGADLLEPRRAAEILVRVARAVQYAHDNGVIHRDLKPSNVLVDLEGQPHVTDFGLAKRVESDSDLTRTGQVLGTPSYMPPEQAAGHLEIVGPIADVYSLGAILYTLLTGRPPFQSSHLVDTLKQVVEREPIAPRQLAPSVARDLDTITLKCLEKSVARRYSTADELANELQRFLDGKPIKARPISKAERVCKWVKRRPVVAGLLVALVLSMVIGTTASALFALKATLKAEEAETSQRAAVKKADEALNRLYGAHINQIQFAYDNQRLPEMRSLLDLYRRPTPGERDRRGWEWYHFDRISQERLWPVRITYFEWISEWTPPLTPEWFYDGAFSSDGDLFFVATRGHRGVGESVYEIRSFDSANGRQVSKHIVPGQFMPRGTDILSPNGKWVLTKEWNEDKPLLCVREVTSAEKVLEYPAASLWRRDLRERDKIFPVFSSEGSYLAALTEEFELTVWNLSRGRQVGKIDLRGVLKPMNSRVTGLALSPNGESVAVFVGYPGTVDPVDGNAALVVWNVRDKQQTCRVDLDEFSNRVMSTFSPSGDEVIFRSITANYRWSICNVSTGKTGNFLGHYSAVVISPDGSLMAATSENEIDLIKVRTPSMKDATGRQLPTSLGRWDSSSRDGRRVRIIYGGKACRFSPDGTRLAIVSMDDLTMWSTSLGLGTDTWITPDMTHNPSWGTGFHGDIERLTARTYLGTSLHAFHPKDSLLALGLQDKVVICKPGTGEIVRVFDGLDPLEHPSYSFVFTLAFTSDGSLLIAGSGNRKTNDGIVKGWDVKTGEERFRFTSFDGTVEQIAISEDDAVVAAAVAHWKEERQDGDRIAWTPEITVQLWNLNTRKHVRRLSRTPQVVRTWSSRLGGEHAARSGRSEQAPEAVYERMWFARGDRQLAILPAWRNTVFLDVVTGTEQHAGEDDWRAAIARSRTGRFTAVPGRRENVVKIQDHMVGKPIFEVKGESVTCAAFSPDERRFACLTSPSQPRLKIWDIKTGQKLCDLDAEGISSRPTLEFSYDGSLLAGGGLLWDARPVTAEDRSVREARRLIEFLYNMPLPRSSVVEQIQKNSTITEQVRAHALRFAERLKPQYIVLPPPEHPGFEEGSRWQDALAKVYQESSYRTVRHPHANAYVYDYALAQAQEAHRIAPNEGKNLTTLGMAQCRVGFFQDASTTLTESNERNQDNPADLAFLAMSLHQLGKRKQAKDTLSLLREVIEKKQWSEDPDAQMFHGEAEQMINPVE